MYGEMCYLINTIWFMIMWGLQIRLNYLQSCGK